MSNLEICKLCDQQKKLQESHIIPRFVYRYLKRSSITGYFRHGETPNKRVQDGHKHFLLCSNCENLFSKWENFFARKVFVPLHNEKTIEPYGPWLLKFSTSVSWRILSFYKYKVGYKHFPRELWSFFDNALVVWKKFLLDDLPHPMGFQQHIAPFPGVIGKPIPPGLPTNINRYIFRSVDLDVAHNKEEAFVYTKICRIFLIGFIKIINPNRWRDTKIHVKHGILNRKHTTMPLEFGNFINYKAQKAKEAQRKTSENQCDKISQDYRKNLSNFSGSEMCKAMDADFNLFGEAIFDN